MAESNRNEEESAKIEDEQEEHEQIRMIEQLDKDILAVPIFHEWAAQFNQYEQTVFEGKREIKGDTILTDKVLERPRLQISEDIGQTCKDFHEYELSNFYDPSLTIFGHTKRSAHVSSSEEFKNFKKHSNLLITEMASSFEGLIERIDTKYNQNSEISPELQQYFRNGFWNLATGGWKEIAKEFWTIPNIRFHLGNSTAVLDSAFYGFNNILELCLEDQDGIPFTAITTGGFTPLHYASLAGNVESIELILNHQQEIDKFNANGESALMIAAERGYIDCVKLLHQNGASINLESANLKETALTLACLNGNEQVVTYLLDSGANKNHLNKYERTPILEAAQRGDINILKLLITNKEELQRPKDAAESPLTLAASNGHFKLVQILIKRGADIEESNYKDFTPLMEACANGFFKCVKFLVKNGAAIDKITPNGECALNLAIRRQFKKIVKFLLIHNADVENGYPRPLILAAKKGFYEIVKILLISGANIHEKDALQITALEYACLKGFTNIVDLLHQFGALLDPYFSCGFTPLMIAVAYQRICLAHYLLSKNVNVDKISRNNQCTALIIASKYGDMAMTELLLNFNADRYITLNKNGNTSLLTAIKYKHVNIIDILINFHPIQFTFSQLSAHELKRTRENYLYSALAYALAEGDSTTTRILIGAGAPLFRQELPRSFRNSILKIAKKYKNKEMAALICSFIPDHLD